MFAALTLAPAILVIGSKFGLFDPKRELSTRGWRKVGTVVVRWPKPIIVVTCAIAIIGFISLLTYVPQYNDQKYTPADMPANIAYAAADRHFSQARMNPELFSWSKPTTISRNPSDMLVIDRIAKSIFHLRGIERVQTITRPWGRIEHSSIPFQIAMQNSATLQTAKIQNDNTAQMLEQADELTKTIANMEHMYSGFARSACTTTTWLTLASKSRPTPTPQRSHRGLRRLLPPLRTIRYREPHSLRHPGLLVHQSRSSTLRWHRQSDRRPWLRGQLHGELMRSCRNAGDSPPTIASMKTMRDFMVASRTARWPVSRPTCKRPPRDRRLMGQKYFDEAKNDDFPSTYHRKSSRTPTWRGCNALRLPGR